MYNLTTGVVEERMVEKCRRTGTEVPRQILDKPELMVGLSFYLEAFQRLSTDRICSDGHIGPIPYSSIRNYALDYGIDIEDFESHIRALDSAFIEHGYATTKKK